MKFLIDFVKLVKADVAFNPVLAILHAQHLQKILANFSVHAPQE
jgi:hypothetical protein